MTKKSLLLAASIAALALGGNARASTTDAGRPHPIAASIVKPDGLPPHFSGAVIDVEFALDSSGQPRDIQVLRVSDPVLKRQLLAAFRHWRFESGTLAATNSKRFILPIQLTPEV